VAARSSVMVRLVPPVVGLTLLCARASPPDSPPPKGWVQTSEPDEATLKCANGSRPDWMVGLRKGAVVVGDLALPSSDFPTSVSLPFRLPEKLKPWGGVQVLKLSDGFLVGSSAGEFGGRLVFFAPDGRTWRELSDENVTGLLAVRGGEVLVLQGLNHLWTRRGYVRWLSHTPGGGWRPVEERSLDSGPETFAVVRDDVYVLTNGALYRVTPDRKVENLGSLPLFYLYPSTMVADRAGTLWVGMRYFLLRLVPLEHSVSRTWFIRVGGSLSRDNCAY
jgi:Bifunctional DNA primase/polymerase, N-terminal